MHLVALVAILFFADAVRGRAVTGSIKDSASEKADQNIERYYSMSRSYWKWKWNRKYWAYGKMVSPRVSIKFTLSLDWMHQRLNQRA